MGISPNFPFPDPLPPINEPSRNRTAPAPTEPSPKRSAPAPTEPSPKPPAPSPGLPSTSLIANAIKNADRNEDGWVDTVELQMLGSFPAFHEDAAYEMMRVFSGGGALIVDEANLRTQLFNRLVDLMPTANARPDQLATNAMEWFRMADSDGDGTLTSFELAPVMTMYHRRSHPSEPMSESAQTGKEMAALFMTMLFPSGDFGRTMSLSRAQLADLVTEIVSAPPPVDMKEFAERRINQSFDTFQRPLSMPSPQQLSGDEVEWVERQVARTGQAPIQTRVFFTPIKDVEAYVVDNMLYAKIERLNDQDFGPSGWFRIGLVPGALS